MHLQYLLVSLGAAAASATPAQAKCPPFPASVAEFSAGFQQPSPPLIQSEFNTSFVQHKWNQELSHITAGYIVNSPTRKLVRVDEAYDGGLASSLFNYANVTDGGLVDNTLTTYGGASPDQITVWRGFVNSNFPLFSADLLAQSGAVFGGLMARELIRGQVASVGPSSTAQPLRLLTTLGLSVEYSLPGCDNCDRLCGRVQRRRRVRLLFPKPADKSGQPLLQHPDCCQC
jgi:hypothetical protein